MSAYVAIRTYKLKPGTDRAAFEKAFEDVEPSDGLQKVILLNGYQGDQPHVAKGEVDYVSLHVYDSDEACTEFFQRAYEAPEDADHASLYPEALQPFLRTVFKAHLGETAESSCHGYTVAHGSV